MYILLGNLEYTAVFLLLVHLKLQVVRTNVIAVSPPRGTLIRPTCIGTRIVFSTHILPTCRRKHDLIVQSSLSSLL